MTKNWLRRLAALTMAGVGLAGAGGAHAQDQITLNWALWDWAATAYYQPLIDAYQAAHPRFRHDVCPSLVLARIRAASCVGRAGFGALVEHEQTGRCLVDAECHGERSE